MIEEFEAKSTDGKTFKFRVRETTRNTENMKAFLKNEWCKCPDSEFLCYPEDGTCSCGTFKHHVHCKKCGGISQSG